MDEAQAFPFVVGIDGVSGRHFTHNEMPAKTLFTSKFTVRAEWQFEGDCEPIGIQSDEEEVTLWFTVAEALQLVAMLSAQVDFAQGQRSELIRAAKGAA